MIRSQTGRLRTQSGFLRRTTSTAIPGDEDSIVFRFLSPDEIPARFDQGMIIYGEPSGPSPEPVPTDPVTSVYATGVYEEGIHA